MRTALAAALLLIAAAQPVHSVQQTQIFVNFSNETGKIIVSWTDSDPGAVQDIVQWSLSADFTNVKSSRPGVLSSYSTPAGGTGIFGKLPAYASGVIHRATLDGVPAGVRVFYRIGSPLNGYSARGNFTSHPGVGADVPIRMLVLADHDVDCYTAETGKECNPAAVLGAVTKPAVRDAINAGAIILGDLAYANGNQSHWDLWQDVWSDLTSAMATQTNAGNHVRASGGWRVPWSVLRALALRKRAKFPGPSGPGSLAPQGAASSPPPLLPHPRRRKTNRAWATTASSPSRRASAACPFARTATARSSTRTRSAR
jgi:hypothetical protein